MKKVFEPVTKSIKDVSKCVTETLTESCFKKNKALAKINDKLSKILSGRSVIATFLLSPLSKITIREHTSQFQLLKVPNPKRVNHVLINKTVPPTLYDILLIFRDKDKKFERQGDGSKMIANKNYKKALANFIG